MLGKLFVALLIVAGIIVWIGQRNSGEDAPAAVAEALDPTAFRGEGIVIRYQSADLPVYYLLYETEGHTFMRKELRFTDERGCNAQAGDLPCVFPSGGNPLPVSIGTHVLVSGTADAQRISVDTLEVVSDAERDYELVKIGPGERAQSEKMEILVERIYSDGGCELFLGCFQEDIPRVEFEVSLESADNTYTLVPGMLKSNNEGAVLLLWADVERQEALFVFAHGESR